MDPYKVYGNFYDATQKPSGKSAYRQLLRKYHSSAASVLETACGTASHMEILAKDYAVEGLDVSVTMLRHAKERMPGTTFHRASMVDFDLGKAFDAVVCPYDSMNHLLKFEDWVRTYKVVARHLLPGGMFIFDINTEDKLKRMSDGPTHIQRFGENVMLMDVTKASGGVYDWGITNFERVSGSAYRRHQETIQECSFPHAKVVSSLRSICRNVRGYDANGWGRPKMSSERLFYVCKK